MHDITIPTIASLENEVVWYMRKNEACFNARLNKTVAVTLNFAVEAVVGEGTVEPGFTSGPWLEELSTLGVDPSAAWVWLDLVFRPLAATDTNGAMCQTARAFAATYLEGRLTDIYPDLVALSKERHVNRGTLTQDQS